jgi:hypothetical protein
MAGLVDPRDDSRGRGALSSDDLNAPLGQDKKKRLPKLPANAPQLLAALLGMFGLVVAPRRAASPASWPAARTCPSPRPTSSSTRCRRPRLITRWRGSNWRRASTAAPSAWRVPCRRRLRASPSGRRQWKPRGFVLVPITMVAVKAKSS